MKVRTNVSAGNVLNEAESQAEQLFQQTDAFLADASQKLGVAAGVAADKLRRSWACILNA